MGPFPLAVAPDERVEAGGPGGRSGDDERPFQGRTDGLAYPTQGFALGWWNKPFRLKRQVMVRVFGLKDRICPPRPTAWGLERPNNTGPERAVHLPIASDSIPHVPFVPFDTVPSQPFPHLVLERLLGVMLRLLPIVHPPASTLARPVAG